MGTSGMRYSLLSREMICDSVETITKAHHYDGLVLIGSCDKNLPGLCMSLLEINRPGFLIYGGSSSPVFYKNQKLDIVDAFESYGKYLNNEISDFERENIVQNSCNKNCGTCAGYYTANTMAIILEVMGLLIPNSSSNLSQTKEKFSECSQTHDIINRLFINNLKPKDILTKKSFINGIRMLYIIGGSTNAIIHLLAISKSANISLTYEDFKKEEHLPILLNMKPHGTHFLSDLTEIGGSSMIIKYLIDNNILHSDVLTITTKTLKNNYNNIPNLNFDNQNIIFPFAKPFKKSSHIKLLRGNIAKNFCISKIYNNDSYYSGKIKVFDSEIEFLENLEKNLIKENDAILIRYQSEKVGSPEMLLPSSALKIYFKNSKNTPILLTDGRFSGGSSGVLVCHIDDGFDNTNLTNIIQNDDILTIDLNKSEINIEISKEEIVKRKNKIVVKKLDLSGVLAKYSKNVGDITSGFST
tara:strand:- start:93 stop:1502 length:1410 start_codon:yes stop_codon:yes gene_type:complete